MSAFLAPYGDYGVEWLPLLLRAMVNTALLSVCAFALAFVFGLLLSLCQKSSFAALRYFAALYVTIVRGVPLLAVLFLLYFGLPGIGIVFDAFGAAIAGLALCFAAQVAELFRAGLKAIPAGQSEAALAAGFTPAQSFVLIILPQVARVILAPMIITFVSLLKDSSLASLITVNELVLTGRSMATEYFLPLQIYIAVGLCYFAIAWPFSVLARRLALPAAR
ncbi:polar amino acid transport system permease protein [Rhizobium leguminosarum]|uniref:Polar amino acid transport system permease protein n=1 Tax=Rhizobium leguminosarum TaxID=384 RepID=A0AAE2MIM7_RHILE|nr:MULTISPECIES: amino acid ABC transporter permease [Rhizobium]MBB4289882.1 polar amino acid transport system permease protein [Rhizobium leguminosarum]MBB4296525.1 polar amino acid transport system permease protein [Rhizobium leguminosarum]MBB4308214.1 polar amino acid transport system permease protein [Rhizobium leguminosarum]MBB4416050.1 polar amino acid transport system permease protein [Rhizobium leguminosarum]MBB4430983.1 polar amino acid transport system permease protein [Rhizobium esp